MVNMPKGKAIVEGRCTKKECENEEQRSSICGCLDVYFNARIGVKETTIGLELKTVKHIWKWLGRL